MDSTHLQHAPPTCVCACFVCAGWRRCAAPTPQECESRSAGRAGRAHCSLPAAQLQVGMVWATLTGTPPDSNTQPDTCLRPPTAATIAACFSTGVGCRYYIIVDKQAEKQKEQKTKKEPGEIPTSTPPCLMMSSVRCVMQRVIVYNNATQV